VAAAGVLDDREEAAARVRIDAVASREEDCLGVLHRIGRVVALLGILRVVAEEVHGLPAFEVDDPKRLPFLQDTRPRLPGRDDPILDDAARGATDGSRAHGRSIADQETLGSLGEPRGPDAAETPKW
jgi:hypothetical protein